MESLLNGNSMAYKWAAKYHVLTVGEDSVVLVLHPKNKGVFHISAMRLEDLQKPTYAERYSPTFGRSTMMITARVIPSFYIQEIVTVTLLESFARCSQMSALIVLGF